MRKYVTRLYFFDRDAQPLHAIGYLMHAIRNLRRINQCNAIRMITTQVPNYRRDNCPIYLILGKSFPQKIISQFLSDDDEQRAE